jgi:glycosyltransferase involved in cell wall biosynthesis
MKILMISTDRGVFEKEKAIRKRMIEYGSLVDELRVIVLTKRDFDFRDIQISGNTRVYPTNSPNRWLYVFDAIKIGKQVIGDWGREANGSRDKILITCQDPFETGLVGYRLKKIFHIPLQIQVHTDFLSPYFAQQSLLNKIRIKIAKRTLPEADCIRTVSGRIKQSILKTFSKNELVSGRRGYKIKTDPLVLPIFIDKEQFARAVVGDDEEVVGIRQRFSQFRFVILMVVRLTAEKNIPLALRVMQKVAEKYPKTGLIIVGDGPYRRKAESLVNRLGLEDNVILEPWSDNVSQYYKIAHLFLQTSDYEGYGLALLEAALSGNPIVTTDVGIASVLFTDGEDAFVCPVGDEDCITKRVIRVIEDGRLRETFKINVKHIADAELYDKDTYLRKYKEMWEQCVGKDTGMLKC